MDFSQFSDHLIKDASGIWFSQAQSTPISFPETGYQDAFAVEDNSFWFNHRNRCICSLVKQFSPADNGWLFDIGGGNGCVSKALSQSGINTVLVEPGKQGAINGKLRGIEHVICASLKSAQFHPNSLSAVGVFDVVEHIEDDSQFLRDIHHLLTDEGKLYLTVPAYQSLWSHEDEYTGHFRRYNKTELLQRLVQCGYQTLFCSYIFRPLPIAILLQRVLPYRLGIAAKTPSPSAQQRDHVIDQSLSGRLLTRALIPELAKLDALQPMPFGASLIAVAQKAG